MVLITEQVHPAGLALLRARPGLELVEAAPGTPAFLSALARADAIGVRIAPLPADLLSRAPRLRTVAKHGVGTDAVDVAWCTAHGITVTVTPDANTISVAEHTLTLMLAAAKRLPGYGAALRRGDWHIRDSLSAVELSGRTVLVVGFGRIGQRVAALCQAFGMDVLVHSRSGAHNPHRPCPDLDAGLAEAEFVTLHLPRTAATANLLDARRIAAMRPGAILVNCARGGLVDESALAAALRSGHLAAAALDVFATEPLPRGHELSTLPNLLLTPHSAASTEEGARRMALAMAENLLAALDGTLTEDDVINPAALARATPP